MTTTFDFEDGNGPVPANRHVNPDGSEGGWVAGTATVEPTTHVGVDARVFGKAQVSENAMVFGKAEVSGEARVSGNARVPGNAWVCGDAEIASGKHDSGVIDTSPEGDGLRM